MKSALFIFAVTVSLLAVSCKKETTNNTAPPSPDGPVPQTNVIRAKVNGVMKETNEISAWTEDGVFSLYGAKEMNFGWILGFEESVSVGQTLTIDEDDPQAFIYFGNLATQTEYTAISGQLTVTLKDTVNHKIAGTFNCELYNDDGNVTATEGYFNVPYIVQ